MPGPRLQLQELPTDPIGGAAGERAPGLPERVLTTDVIGPADRTAGDSHALDGAPCGGSAEEGPELLVAAEAVWGGHATALRSL